MPKILAIAGLAIVAIVAPPVAAALAAGGGWAAASAAAGTALGALVGGSGIAAAVAAWGTVALVASTALRPNKVGQGAGGTQVDLQADPLSGIPLMLGTSGTAGKIIHANTTGEGDKNRSLFYLLALTAGAIAAPPSQVFANELPVEIAGNIVTSPPQFAQKMHFEFSLGSKPEGAAHYPAGFDPSLIPEWTDAHKISGVATAWWTLVYDAKAYPTGVPKPMFVVKGPAVYDPRQDDTYPGGTGPQRWNDELTWGFGGNDNPFLQALTWAIGRHDNGVLTFGIGAPIEAIDLPAFVEGANVCDANAWTVGGEVLSSDSKWGVLKTILQAGGGEPLKLAGKLSCHVRAPRVVLGNLTGREVIGDVSITGTKRRRDRFNQIIPNYRSADHRYEIVPAGPVVVDSYVTADGGVRSREGSYLLVQQPKQAAELAAYDIVDAREFEPIILPLGPKWAAFKPGDCLTITEPEFGMLGQQVIIQTRDLDPTTGQITLTCRTETPEKHEYALGRTPNPPPIPGFTPLDPSIVARPDAGSWQAFGGVLTGADGSTIPAIWVTGSLNDPNVSEIIVEYQLQLSPGVFGDWVSAGFPPSTRRMEFRAVISGATYHVQVRYRSVRDVDGALALDLGLVTVGTLISGGVTEIGGQTPQELIDQLNETTELGLETAEKAADTAADLLTLTTDVVSTDHRIDLIGFERPGGLTFQMSDSTLYADNTQSWGTYRQSIQTGFNNANAAITTEQNVRAAQDTALATSISNLNTTVGGNTASITTLQTSVNGLNAQYVLAVSSTGPGYARVAGIKLASSPTVSSIAFAADQIGFTNGTDNVYPLAVVGGKVIATNFQADDIKANTITANMIIGGAITSTVVYGGGVQPNFVGGDVEDLRFNYTSIGGVCSISVYGELGTTGAAAAGTVFTLYCDDTSPAGAVGSGAIYCPGSWGGTGLTFPVAHQPAAGPHTWVLWHRGTGGSGASQVNRTTVILTELKR